MHSHSSQAIEAEGLRQPGPRLAMVERLKRAVGSGLVALEFLTVIRIRRRSPEFDPATFAAAQAWYALIGVLLGAVVGVAWLGADQLLPRAPSTALAVIALAALTGGLHLDGLADSADGLFGGRSREERLAIMRDSHTGSFGAMAIAAALLLKWSALLAIAASGAVFAALLATPAIARGAMVVAVARYPYARPAGMGVGLHDAARSLPGLATVATALLVAALVYGGIGIVVAIGAISGAIALARYPYTKLGGLTGDVYGALIEIVEVALLLTAAAGAEHGWLHPYFWGG